MHGIFNKLGVQTILPKTASKLTIFDAILDSAHLHVTKFDHDTCEYEGIIVPKHCKKGPKCKVLTGMEVELPE